MHSRESRFLRDGPPRRMPDRRAAVGLLGVRFCHSRRRYRMSRVFNCICGQELRAETEAVPLGERVFREVWENGDEKVAQASFSPDYTNHDPAAPELPPGPRGVIENVRAYRTGFPDLKFTFNETIATGDKVVVRWTVSGTQQGTFRDVPPTRKAVSLSGISVFRITNLKIVESWANGDQPGLYQQIGAAPSLARAGTR